ncbi:hypothetical protein P6P00_14580 [Clostridium perfringens]|nr:hypothetical protein [Clostridium perfringens]
MKKSDLKDGMIVEYKDGKFGLKLGARIISQNEHLELEDLEENLTTENELDVIVRIYESVNVYFFSEINDKNKLKLIWERPREIDWSKVPFGTKVQASDDLNKEDDDLERIFVRYEAKLKEYPFIVAYDTDDDAQSFRYCKIHPDVKIKEEWYK